jgi:hypothetical protein
MTTFVPESFVDASAIRGGDGDFAWDVPDGWQQGRGAFGGLVLGALVRAAEATEGDRARRPRVVTGELCGPVLPGPTTIRVETLRRGSGVSYLEARARRGDDVLARASVVLAGDRKTDAPPFARPAPALPPRDTLAPAALAAPPGPLFTRHLEYHPTGALPFAGGPTGAATGYVGFRVPLPAVDAAALIALLDAWWPAIFAALRAPRPMATVSYTAELVVAPATLDPAAPFAYTARVDAAGGGYVVEQRELFQHDRLVALNQQTFAILA